MARDVLSGQSFSGNFRTDEPVPPVVTGLTGGQFAAARIVHSGSGHGVSQIPAQDAFVLAYLMKPFSQSELWDGGRPTNWDPVQPGQTHFYNLEQGLTANIKDPLDFVFMYVPYKALDEFADEHDLPRTEGCRINSGTAFTDPVVAHLGRSLLPLLKRPVLANQLFIDQTAFRLQSHFLRTYTGSQNRRVFFRGGLTPRQERRAKDLMHSHLDGNVSVGRLAQECGLSRSQFFRAFKRSTSMTPHQWLLQCRVEMAKVLLLTSRLSLAEIAAACGFVSASHFTRTFSRHAGLGPGLWRTVQLD